MLGAGPADGGEDVEHSGPYPPPADALELLPPQSMALVLDRRGSSVWKLGTDRGGYAVKVGYPTKTHSWTALAPAREAEILRTITGELILSGEWERGTWGAQPWRKGKSLYELWAPLREGVARSSRALAQSRACAAAVARLHAKGWAHGDIQPSHFILDGTLTHLIDVALAHGGEVSEAYDFPYRGCLVHYEAPEISRRVLEGGTATPSYASDVYALGASLLLSATGKRHVRYPDEASRTIQREAVAKGPGAPVAVTGKLGEIIHAMLERDPRNRPTISDVMESLS
ncbi:protein kinase [Streptomyces sp. NPDC088923]|uniref:protein kinase domain-containing protein n=1 Tax=Streptomyces sp. NPDC088923 TaxID=3365913 RepID=UPI0037FCB5B7